MTIHWPQGLSPDETPVHTRNELVVGADIDRVWTMLVDARSWPDWYRNARNVKLEDATELGPGTRFRWTTFNVRVDCVVTFFDPQRELGWTGTALGTRGHHRWQLTPRPDGRTHVVTEETQRGAIPSLADNTLRRCLLHWHQRWLEGLDRGDPPRS